jgi:hypothetical protein
MREHGGIAKRPDPTRCVICRADRHRQVGASLLELLVVLVMLAMIFVISISILTTYYRNQQLISAAMTVQNSVWGARFLALKERAPHRVLIRDDDDPLPNRIEVQRLQGTSFVTLPEKTYSMPAGVRILGAGPNDSTDRVEIGRRGECIPGFIFLGGHGGQVSRLSISAGCLTEEL